MYNLAFPVVKQKTEKWNSYSNVLLIYDSALLSRSTNINLTVFKGWDFILLK